MKEFKASVIIEAIDKVTQPLKIMTSSFKASGEKIQGTFKRANQEITRGLSAERDYSIVANMASQASQQLMAALGAITDKGGTFEESMSKLQSATMSTKDGIKALGDQALKLGPKYGFFAYEGVDAMTDLAKSGMNTKQIFEAMPGTLNLAKAGMIDLSQAAELGVNTMSAFGLKAKDFSTIADVLVGAADASTISVEDMAETLKYASSAAHLAHASLKQVGALAAIIGNVGIKGSMAGTAIRNTLLRMSEPKVIKNLKQLGVATVDSQKNLRDFPSILGDIAQAMNDKRWGSAQKIAFIGSIFGQRAAPAMMKLLDAGPEKINKMAQAIAQQGLAAKKTAIMMDNWNSTKKQIATTVESLGIQAFYALLPVLKPIGETIKTIVTSITKWAKENPKVVRFLFIAGAIASALMSIVSVIFTVIATVGALSGAIQAGITVFQGLSIAALGPWGLLIAAIVAAVALIIANWKKVTRFFQVTWAVIKYLFISAWNKIKQALQNPWILGVLLMLHPFLILPTLIIKNWDKVKSFFISVFKSFKEGFMRYMQPAIIMLKGLRLIGGKIWDWGSRIADTGSPTPKVTSKPAGGIVITNKSEAQKSGKLDIIVHSKYGLSMNTNGSDWITTKKKTGKNGLSF